MSLTPRVPLNVLRVRPRDAIPADRRHHRLAAYTLRLLRPEIGSGTLHRRPPALEVDWIQAQGPIPAVRVQQHQQRASSLPAYREVAGLAEVPPAS